MSYAIDKQGTLDLVGGTNSLGGCRSGRWRIGRERRGAGLCGALHGDEAAVPRCVVHPRNHHAARCRRRAWPETAAMCGAAS